MHKATVKQIVISVPYMFSEILISKVFDSTLEKIYFQKSPSYYMQRPTAYFGAIKEWRLYHLVVWDISDVIWCDVLPSRE